MAQLLALTVLLGGMPMAVSAVITKPDCTPAFTLDICHPLPVLAVSTASCTPAACTIYSFLIAIERRGPAELSELSAIDHDSEAPDPPPPKSNA